MLNKPKKVINPFRIKSSNPNSYPSKIICEYLDIKKQMTGEITATNGTHLSITFLFEYMPKTNKPNSGPYV